MTYINRFKIPILLIISCLFLLNSCETFDELREEELQNKRTEIIEKYYKNRELDLIEGIWIWPNNSFEIAIFKKTTKSSQSYYYKGIIFNSSRIDLEDYDTILLLKVTENQNTYATTFYIYDYNIKNKYNTFAYVLNDNMLELLIPFDRNGAKQKILLFKYFPSIKGEVNKSKIVSTLKNRDLDIIEGVWLWTNNEYEIVFIKNTFEIYSEYDYLGIITNSNNELWKLGETKILLKKTADDYIYTTNYFDDYEKTELMTTLFLSEDRNVIEIGEGLEGLRLIRTFPKIEVSLATEPKEESISVKSSYKELPLVAVLDFNIENIPKNEGVVIIDLLGSALLETKQFRILERNQREKIFGEIAFSFEDCVEEACQIEAGKLLATNKIVVGSLANISSRYIFNTKLIDVETGETIATAAEVFKSMEELIDSITIIAKKLSED